MALIFGRNTYSRMASPNQLNLPDLGPICPVKVTAENGSYKVQTPYNSQFVGMLKVQIPTTGRKWDGFAKVWLVAPQFKAQLEEVCKVCFGAAPVMPNIIAEPETAFETVIRAEYVGNCNSASGVSSVFCEGGWNAKIPEKALREWFKQTEANAGTLYALLGCDEKATAEEIKKAYKRAARQWHPDICREANAREMFESVKDAFDTLSNFELRNKYNAGLFFERMARGNRKSSYATFTPVLRCGLIRAIGVRELGTFIISEILAWDDITNDNGQTMVAYWDGTSHAMMWV